jgi:hypothetical protein
MGAEPSRLMPRVGHSKPNPRTQARKIGRRVVAASPNGPAILITPVPFSGDWIDDAAASVRSFS